MSRIYEPNCTKYLTKMQNNVEDFMHQIVQNV